MIRYVLDTDHFSLLYRGDPIVSRNLRSHQQSETAITVVSIEETLSGWYSMLRKAKDLGALSYAYRSLDSTVKLLCTFNRIPFDDRAAVDYRELLDRKTRIGKMDLRIAAAVIVADATLVTRNVKDFRRIPELRLVDWSMT